MHTSMSSSIPDPTYADYARRQPGRARKLVRGAALTALAATAQLTGQIERALVRPRVQFIFLHHVFSDEIAGFRRMLTSLAQHHKFISHSDAVRRINGGEIDRPYVSLGFDDGFADNVRAATILEEFSATGCFFICPGLVGVDDPTRLRNVLHDRFDFPILTPFMTWADIEELKSRGHEIGGHTMTHVELANVPPEVAQQEIRDTHAELFRRLGAAEHFAWPKGRWCFFSPLARDAAFDAGFTSCSSAVRGCHVAPHVGPPRDLCIRRDHVFANWPVDHVNYLLMQNSRSASAASNDWPVEYPRAAVATGAM